MANRQMIDEIRESAEEKYAEGQRIMDEADRILKETDNPYDDLPPATQRDVAAVLKACGAIIRDQGNLMSFMATEIAAKLPDNMAMAINLMVAGKSPRPGPDPDPPEGWSEGNALKGESPLVPSKPVPPLPQFLEDLPGQIDEEIERREREEAIPGPRAKTRQVHCITCGKPFPIALPREGDLYCANCGRHLAGPPKKRGESDGED
jgi:hypothetical protein